MIYTDQLLRKVNIPEFPSRIVSLVPSITELLSDLGLQKQIVGITKFCIHPEIVFRTKTRVGGTKNIDFTKIQDLQPDLIIASKEENVKSDIDELEKHFPVYVTDVKNLDDALNMISELGKITNRKIKADEIKSAIVHNFSRINPLDNLSSLYLIWKNPFISVGGDTFINDMMKINGMKNVLENEQRYPELTIEEIKQLNPQIVVLSSEPFPFKNNDITYFKSLLPDSAVVLGDGEFFSWYGSKLIGTPYYFKEFNQVITDEISAIN